MFSLGKKINTAPPRRSRSAQPRVPLQRPLITFENRGQSTENFPAVLIQGTSIVRPALVGPTADPRVANRVAARRSATARDISEKLKQENIHLKKYSKSNKKLTAKSNKIKFKPEQKKIDRPEDDEENLITQVGELAGPADDEQDDSSSNDNTESESCDQNSANQELDEPVVEEDKPDSCEKSSEEKSANGSPEQSQIMEQLQITSAARKEVKKVTFFLLEDEPGLKNEDDVDGCEVLNPQLKIEESVCDIDKNTSREENIDGLANSEEEEVYSDGGQETADLESFEENIEEEEEEEEEEGEHPSTVISVDITSRRDQNHTSLAEGEIEGET